MIFAPLFGGGGNDHVGGASLENARLEDVEDICDAVEHSELAVPLSEGAGGFDACLAGDRGDVDAQLGQGAREAVDAQEHVGGLFVGGQHCR